MPNRAQYALVLLAVTFTWLMGLMGYARNAIRQDWHVYGVVRDTSPDAFSPALGYAAIVISVCVIIFLCFIAFIFWLGEVGERYVKRVKSPREPATQAAQQAQPQPQFAQPSAAQATLEYQPRPAGGVEK
jgi:cytochrome bd-type quinol oxidase subunit 1